ncbi:MAG: type III secretion system inner membrane ring subunit SctD [Chlamydiota bacterium]
MAGYLIAEEGPLAGLIIRFEVGNEWSLGRDPDIAGIVLEDPMVSRKHVVVRLTHEGYLLENLSAVNPATQNGMVITDAILMHEGDIIQIGSTFFHFTEIPQENESKEEPLSFEESEDLSSVNFTESEETRWLLKVIAGPNAGAEFNMQRGSTYIAGKDASLSDIVFQDLSVSRQHARISVDEQENVFIEDLSSRNGVLVNGDLITDRHQISSQDLIALGTTTFLIIDRHDTQETIMAPAATTSIPKAESKATRKEGTSLPPPPVKDWRELVVPKRHLIVAAVFAVLLLFGIMGLVSLFKSEPIVTVEKHEGEQIQKAIENYKDVQFSFNEMSGKLFLVGHVLTTVDKQELTYTLRNFPFVLEIDDNVVVDELVWQNMNALLMTNSSWIGVSIYAPEAGHFVLRGYVQTLEELQALVDYVNVNFPYLDRLDNIVVVENNLTLQIDSMLLEKGFSGVSYQLSNGELVLVGRVDARESHHFTDMMNEMKALSGIRLVKSFVIYTTADTSRIDLSDKYRISGYSTKDSERLYVVIGGKILTTGDILDGMIITGVQQNMVLLEKDGLKFKINYNLQ